MVMLLTIVTWGHLDMRDLLLGPPVLRIMFSIWYNGSYLPLTRDPMGGGQRAPSPCVFFGDNSKTAMNFAAPFSVPLRTSISRIPWKIWVIDHVRSRVIEVNLRSCSSIFGRKLVNGEQFAENQINKPETPKSDHRHKKAWQKLLSRNFKSQKILRSWDFSTQNFDVLR